MIPPGLQIRFASATVAIVVTILALLVVQTEEYHAWSSVVNHTRRLARDLEMLDTNAHLEGEPVADEVSVNEYLSTDREDNPNLWLLSRDRDPWGSSFRVRRNITSTDGSFAPVGAFSLGEDRTTRSGGDDADDINSWDPDSVDYYMRRERNREALTQVFAFMLLGLPTYLVCSWYLKRRMHSHRTER